MTAEVLAQIRTKDLAFVPMRLNPAPIKVAGTQSQLREAQGLSVEGVIATAEEMLRGIGVNPWSDTRK